MKTRPLRILYTRIAVIAIAVVFIAACAGWAMLAQHLVPTACALHGHLPPRTGPFNCPHG